MKEKKWKRDREIEREKEEEKSVERVIPEIPLQIRARAARFLFLSTRATNQPLPFPLFHPSTISREATRREDKKEDEEEQLVL